MCATPDWTFLNSRFLRDFACFFAAIGLFCFSFRETIAVPSPRPKDAVGTRRSAARTRGERVRASAMRLKHPKRAGRESPAKAILYRYSPRGSSGGDAAIPPAG